MPDLVLRIEPHMGETFTHLMNGESIVFGRSSKADLVVPDRYMSRQQGRFFRDGDNWMLEDLGGRNPTLLNGRAITAPARIVPGDLIVVSDTRIHVEGRDQPLARMDSTVAGVSVFKPAQTLLLEMSEVAAAARASRTEDGGTGGAGTGTGQGMRDSTARLRRLNEFHRVLAAPIAMDALFELVLDRAFADLWPEEAVIFLKQPDGEFVRVAQRRLPGASAEFLYSRSLAREVADKGMAALVEDTTADDRFKEAVSIQSAGVRSLVAAPLLDSEGSPGFIVLSSRINVRSFTEHDMEELVFLAAAAAMRMRNIGLAEEAAKRKVLEKELAIARQIQMALLPATLPEVPGFELFASNIPTRAVSGDLYQAQMRREERECVMMLADVAGKGISASLLTASLEALSTGPIEVGYGPDGICTRLSRRLYARTSPERYATAFVAVLHTETGRFCWANAGHNAALLLRASGAHEELAATGLPLGLLPTGEYERRELTLEPGDLVIIYTDGVTEAANPEGEEYGLARLIELGRTKGKDGVRALSDALQADLDGFAKGVPFADDRTFIMLRRLP